MIDALIILLIAPVAGAIIWNGLHGKGYVFVYKAPPLCTAKGLIARVLGFIYAAILLSVAFINKYNHSTNEGYWVTGRIISIASFFAIIIALNMTIRIRRNK